MKLVTIKQLSEETGYSVSHLAEMTRTNGRGIVTLPTVKQVRACGWGTLNLYDLEVCSALLASIPRGQRGRRQRNTHKLETPGTWQARQLEKL